VISEYAGKYFEIAYELFAVIAEFLPTNKYLTKCILSLKTCISY